MSEDEFAFKSIAVTMREEDYAWIMETFGEKSWATVIEELRQKYEFWQFDQIVRDV